MAEVPNLNYIKEIAGGNEEFEKKFLSIIQAEFPKEKDDYLSLLENGELEVSTEAYYNSLLDTGASFSILPSKYFSASKKSTVKLSTANKSSLEVKGEIYLTITIKSLNKVL